VRVDYEISNGSVLAGTGRVLAPAGSPLARLVGTNPSAIAVLITFDFQATTKDAGS
jgi:hypothetical protein